MSARLVSSCLVVILLGAWMGCGGVEPATDTSTVNDGSIPGAIDGRPAGGADSTAGGFSANGACCFGPACGTPTFELCCFEVDPDTCQGAGGAFMGAGTSCATEICTVFLELDSDNDGRSDAEEIAGGLDPDDPTDGPDIDGDGIPNGEDDDVDGDGFLNVDDHDIDGDGILNEFDLDDDGDGLPDAIDFDDDADGVADFDDDPQDGECDENGDCGRGQVCDEAVIAGAILNQCEEPQACPAGSAPGEECGPNKVCDEKGRCLSAGCSRDSDCPSGEVCRFEVCQDRTCGADPDEDECRNGEVCDGNRCRPMCESASDCRNDEECSGDPARCVPAIDPDDEEESEASADDSDDDSGEDSEATADDGEDSEESEATAEDSEDSEESEEGDESEATAEEDESEASAEDDGSDNGGG